jgi:hypothetical protein
LSWLSDPAYWLSRLIFTRALSVVYLVAFVVAANQCRALMGERGILPVPKYLSRTSFRRSPSLFHLHHSDRFFTGCCWAGALLSIAVLCGAVDRAPLWLWMAVWLACWCLYLSIVNVGQVWYSFGWESLLLETGFLAIFLGPSSIAPPGLILWLLRWLLFRLEFGAGLIKLRGDRCWRDLTCLNYHHETQPMPNPFSWYFHHLPPGLHKVEVLANYFTQLIVVFGLFAPQPVASVCALVIVVTQAWLMLSGNFSWLNALTMVIALSVIEGRYLHYLFPFHATAQASTPDWFGGVVAAVAAGVVLLSYWPVRNLLSGHQRMNASFNAVHLVNTYGAFGHVTRLRHEVIIEGSEDPHPGPETEWKEYQFKGKPGDPGRRPPQIAPYHLRLDWLLWFVGISPAYAEPWLVPFLAKLLQNDRSTLKLLRSNPFSTVPPASVRASLYRYRFTTAEERRQNGTWWNRTRVGELIRPISLRQSSSAA